MYCVILGRVKPIFILLSVFLVLFSCNDSDKVAQEIAAVPIDLNISRFDREFASAGAEGLPVLRKKYPYLFPAPDSVWVAKMQDSLQIELFQEVGNTFQSFEDEKESIIQLFKHIKYYFPEYTVPKIITVTNDVDYNNRIILADSILFVSLDNYLGAEHKYYGGFQRYIAKSLDRNYLVSDIASAFAKQVVPRPRDRTFLARMIYFGKELYLKDLFMPNANDGKRIGYSQDEMDWAIANEEPMWRNFIENEYLYSTDNKLNQRFLEPAPFSKFGLELDNESPGRLGRYVGWQIVRAFMENNDVDIKQLMTMPADEIFKKSNYKPRN
ncbi:gliding motility lipoprotein GldB [Maribacter hydrothermalis]|uniref:Gliding motility lipoprotein GldB n=1 Tax=Maribacter hydrothermalis TaxID=1836467 RepID=A0A1B7ZDX0_9FLAO|nr:gliding motility lipoprotein GldB [Maribacter hydrothermalis]APQ16592.1 gliding motility lipoprotein GldB [Maribacter hydrothermalis]OBR41503.1 gliding motility lipoprotein GldB [Maribacter hydrothermalis]